MRNSKKKLGNEKNLGGEKEAKHTWARKKEEKKF